MIFLLIYSDKCTQLASHIFITKYKKQIWQSTQNSCNKKLYLLKLYSYLTGCLILVLTSLNKRHLLFDVCPKYFVRCYFFCQNLNSLLNFSPLCSCYLTMSPKAHSPPPRERKRVCCLTRSNNSCNRD